jgi:hypothetical protein
MFYGIKAYQEGKGKPPQSRKIVDEKPFTSDGKVDSSFLPFYDGKHIGRYQLYWKNDNWLKYGPWLAEPRQPEKFEGEKLLVRKIVGQTLIATYVPETSYCNTLLYVIRLNANSPVAYKALLGILNSRLIGWYYKSKFQISVTDTFPQIMISDILAIPIPTSSAIGASISFMVDQMLETKKRLAIATRDAEHTQLEGKCAWIDSEIDKLVYQLYGLTDEEIQIVEGN